MSDQFIGVCTGSVSDLIGPDGRARLDLFVRMRTGPGGCRTRHLGLCGREDKSGASVPLGGWQEVHPAFRCAACSWIAGRA